MEIAKMKYDCIPSYELKRIAGIKKGFCKDVLILLEMQIIFYL